MDSQIITVTSNSSGVGSATSKLLLGKVAAISYTKTATPFSDGVVVLVKTVRSGITIWSETLSDNESKIIFPRHKTHTTLGAEALYASGGTNVLAEIPVINDQIVISVSGGGNGLTGTFEVILV